MPLVTMHGWHGSVFEVLAGHVALGVLTLRATTTVGKAKRRRRGMLPTIRRQRGRRSWIVDQTPPAGVTCVHESYAASTLKPADRGAPFLRPHASEAGDGLTMMSTVKYAARIRLVEVKISVFHAVLCAQHMASQPLCGVLRQEQDACCRDVQGRAARRVTCRARAPDLRRPCVRHGHTRRRDSGAPGHHINAPSDLNRSSRGAPRTSKPGRSRRAASMFSLASNSSRCSVSAMRSTVGSSRPRAASVVSA